MTYHLGDFFYYVQQSHGEKEGEKKRTGVSEAWKTPA